MREKIAINREDVSWTFWEYLCFKCKVDPFKTKNVLLTVVGYYAEEYQYQHSQEIDDGCVVYNTNNYTYGVVLNGKCGEDKDPRSKVLELTGGDGVMVHTPPNRALIPTGRFIDIAKMINHAIGVGHNNGC